jgi:hypothetical protein
MSKKHTIRTALVGTVAAGALLVVAALSSGWSVASSAPPPSPASARPAAASYPHHYLDHVVQQKWFPAGPTELGATVATTSNVLDFHGTKLGTEDFTCTVVGVTPPADLMQCMGQTQLPNGRIDALFLLNRADLETVGAHYTTEQVGGTGAFAGVHGETNWTVLAPGLARADSVDLTFPS